MLTHTLRQGRQAALQLRHLSRTCRVITRLGALSLAAAVFSNSAYALPVLLEVPQAQERDFSAPIAGTDTAAVHRALRKSIERFQDSWRKAWQRVEVKRHGFIGLNNIRGWNVRSDGLIEDPRWNGDRSAMNLTPDLRRYLAILCNIDSPTDLQIEYVKSRKGQDIGTQSAQVAPLAANAPGGTAELRPGTFQRSLSNATERLIAATPNYGAICPSWIADEKTLPLDEGESIDLALPPANREVLRREREALIRILNEALAKYPHDDWIAGQHMRFVLDQRAPARALAAARECRGSALWCAGLMGLAYEHAGDFVLAEAAYRAADSLSVDRAANRAVACVDREVLLLMAPADRDELGKASCDEQRLLGEHLWWLADPLWSVPGNERYVAHKSRLLHGSLRAVLNRDERYVWSKTGGGDSMRELLVRYGWPSYTYWPGGPLEEEINKVRENPARARVVSPPYTAKEYSPDRTALIPRLEAAQFPFKTASTHWNLSAPAGSSSDTWWPQEHMMLWTKLRPLAPGQSAEWRRDSTVLFAMAVDNVLQDLDTAARGPTTAALVASRGPKDMSEWSVIRFVQGETLRLQGEFTSAPFVLSAEVQSRTSREPAWRLRYGLQPAPTLREMPNADVALSDPVFVRLSGRGGALPATLEAARPLMTGGLTFTTNDTLALFWESYGFARGDTIEFELRINRRDDISIARRIGAALGVASALRDSIGIKWTEAAARDENANAGRTKTVIGRSVAVDFKGLPPGVYVATIEMRKGGSVSARSERRFEIKQ